MVVIGVGSSRGIPFCSIRPMSCVRIRIYCRGVGMLRDVLIGRGMLGGLEVVVVLME